MRKLSIWAKFGVQQWACRNFDQIFTFLWLLCPSSFTNPGKIWQQTVDPWSTLTRQISFEFVFCVTFQGQKRNFGQRLTFRGLLFPAPLPIRAKFCVLISKYNYCKVWGFHRSRVIKLTAVRYRPSSLRKAE